MMIRVRLKETTVGELLLILTFLIFNVTYAQEVSFTFSGFITGISDKSLLPSLTGDETFTGIYTFDTTFPDQQPGDIQGEYVFGSPFNFTVHIAGLTFTQELTKIIIFDNLPSGGAFLDRYYVRSDGTSVSEFAELTVDARSVSPSLINSDDLPLIPPDLALVNVFPNFQFFTTGLGFVGILTSLTTLPPDRDGDGVTDDSDDCPASDLSPTVIIDECDSGVDNTLFIDDENFGNGCTLADLIMEIAADANSHGQFVSGVAHLTNDLKKAGIISGSEKGAIQSCAAQSTLP